MRWLWWALAMAVLVCGCAPEENSGVTKPIARESNDNSSLRVAFSTLIASTRSIGVRTSEDVLFRWKREATALEHKLADLPTRSNLDELELEVVRNYLARIDAALNVKSLQSQLEAAIREEAGRSNLDQTALDRYRARLRDTDPAFRLLDDGLAAATRKYTDASNQLAKSLETHQSLTSKP